MQPNLQQSIEAKRANIAKWRASRTHTLTLDSGLELTVRDSTIMDLVVTGNIPQTMLDMIVAEADGKTQVDLSKLKSSKDFGALINEMVKIVVLEPRITDQPGDETIGLDELSGADKMQIFNWANREVGAAKAFPERQLQPVAAAPAG